MKQDKTATAIFLAALMIVHISSFGVAFQVYGDPLVLTLTGITFGFLLAMVKNTGESRTYA
jgi:hypothetical protein